MAQRHLVLRLAAAVYGLALAISLLPTFLRPAPAEQLPGAAAAAGFDARASFWFLAAVILLPLASALLLAYPLRRLAGPVTRSWAFWTACTALVTALWTAVIEQNLFWTAIPHLGVFLAVSAIGRHRASFSRRDAILVPTTFSVFLALFDLLPRLVFYQHIILSAILVLAVRVAITAIPRPSGLPASFCFAAAPFGLALQSHFSGYHQRHEGWPVLAIALGTPFVLRLLIRGTPPTRRAIRLAVAWIVYPVAALMYLSATSHLAAEGHPHADLFENAHNLTPANELLRGEMPYRDIITAHGLVQDGLLDSWIMRTGEVTAGRVLETRGVISSFNSVAVYALAACVTGSPDLGILTYFLGAVMGTSGGTLRVLPALVSLALLTAGVRRRNARLIGLAGAGAVIAALTSLDFGAYTFAALIAGVWRFGRAAALRAAAIGVAVAGAIAAISFALFRILDDFLRVTLFEILTLGPVYTLRPFAPTTSLKTRRFFPDVMASLLDRDGFLYIVWIICLLALVVIVSGWRRGGVWTRRRGIMEALIVVLVWIVATAISYAERNNLYFQYVVPVVLVATAYLLTRARTATSRLAGAAVIAIALIAAQPTHYLIVLSMLRRAQGPMAPNLVEVKTPRRAAGALYTARDAETMRIVSDYVSRTLAPDETFFDFTNRGALYFLLNRDVPIRQVEVAFYQTEERQREVIKRITANPKVRLALVPAPGDPTVLLDGVPNETRAPMVWAYLRTHFRPAFEHDNVVFWERVE
jgi:hypothetical protein